MGRKTIPVAAFVLAGAVYAWMLPVRWVTPDEGAHMMSAWRILSGEVPLADYGARQPLYCYIHAFSQLFFGNTLFAGRIVSLLATLAAGWLILLIGRAIRTPAEGVVASVFFLFSPLTIEYAAVVQTQPVVILFSCAAVLILLTRRGWRLAPAGAFLGCAYYVRESSMALLLAAIVWIVLFRGGRSAIRREVVPLLAGFAAVVFLVVLFYLRFLDAGQIWMSRINPLRLGVDAILALTGNAEGAFAPAAGGGVEKTLGRPPSVGYLLVGMRFISFTIIAAAGTVAAKIATMRERRIDAGFWFPVCWIGALILLYGYWFAKRGFFPGYMREFEPPLALLAAIGLTEAVHVVRARRRDLPFLVLLVLAPVAIHQGLFPVWVEEFTLALCAGFGALIVLSAGRVPLKRGVLPLVGGGLFVIVVFFLRRSGAPLAGAPDGLLAVVALVALLAAAALLKASGVTERPARLLLGATCFAAALTATGVARLGGLDFHGPWPVPLTRHVAKLIDEKSAPNDEILSGGVIWSYLADRRPFMGINHPLSFFDLEVDDPETDQFYAAYLQRPPAMVVLDGCTEAAWFKSTKLKGAVERDYDLLFEGVGKDTVKVLIRRSSD